MNAVKPGTQLYKVFQLWNFKKCSFFWCTLYIGIVYGIEMMARVFPSPYMAQHLSYSQLEIFGKFPIWFADFPTFTPLFPILLPIPITFLFRCLYYFLGFSRYISSKRFWFLFIYGASPDRKKNNNCHHAIFSVWFLIKIMCIHFFIKAILFTWVLQ